MKSKEEKERQAKQDLKLTDEEFALYKKCDKIDSLWQEIIDDNSIPGNLIEYANQFRNSLIDVSDPQFLEYLTRYDRETGKTSPLPLSVQELTKEGMVRFLTQLDSLLKPGDEIFDFNILANGRGHVESIEKKWKEKIGECFAISEIKVNIDSKRIKGDKKAKTEAAKTITSKPETKKRIDTLTRSYNIHKQVTDNIKLNKTGEDILEENLLQEQKRTGILELAAGRSNKLIGRHENYRLLTEIPLKKSDVLPMAGLALLVSNSLDINRNISDASTQGAQSFKAKPGVVLTEEEQKYLNQMMFTSEVINVGSKIIESTFGGADIARMGSRCKAVVEARKKLNLAAEEYEKGNKQPLADLMKDSIPVIISSAKDMYNHLADSSGKALSEIIDTIDTLFANDPDLKKSVGMSEADLNKLNVVSKFIKKIVYPAQRQKDSFNKYMVPGSEDKNAYIREMLYSSFLKSKLERQAKNEVERVSKITNDVIEKDLDKLSSRIDVESNGAVLSEFEVASSLSQGILAKTKYENTKWPEIYSAFEKENGEAELIKEFEDNIVNSPEYRALLEKNRDELGSMDFGLQLERINKEIVKRAQQNKVSEVSNKEVPQQNIAVMQNAKPVQQISDNQISPFADEVVRLAGRLKKTHSDKHKNSISYKSMQLSITDFVSKSGEVKTAKDLKDAINSLNACADDYLRDHANDKQRIFNTCGKARRERIKTCARIKAMKELLDKGIAYDSPEGKKMMLACKLVCAEKLAKGFEGFKDLCKDGAIKQAIDTKLEDPVFNIVADKALEKDADYDRLTKMSGSDCLSTYNKAKDKIEKAMGKDKNLVKDQVQQRL